MSAHQRFCNPGFQSSDSRSCTSALGACAARPITPFATTRTTTAFIALLVFLALLVADLPLKPWAGGGDIIVVFVTAD